MAHCGRHSHGILVDWLTCGRERLGEHIMPVMHIRDNLCGYDTANINLDMFFLWCTVLHHSRSSARCGTPWPGTVMDRHVCEETLWLRCKTTFDVNSLFYPSHLCNDKTI